jgi:hydrogenase maturation protease
MIVIGLGNEFRRDDAVGLIAARRLRQHGVRAEEHEGDFVALVDRWKSEDRVILIDAVASGAASGALHLLDLNAAPLPKELFKGSTHAFGLPDAVELSRALGSLPAEVLMIGVEVCDLTAGVGLSPLVEDALPKLVEEVLTCTRRLAHLGAADSAAESAFSNFRKHISHELLFSGPHGHIIEAQNSD